MSDQDKKELVFSFLEKEPKKVIISIKRNIKNVDRLIERYLIKLPSFNAKCHYKNNSPELPCDYWLSNLIGNIVYHCKHCVNKDDCDYEECYENYKSFVDFFCNKCTDKRNIKYCGPQIQRILKNSLKKKEITRLEEKAIVYYTCSCRFETESNSNEKRYSQFRLFNVELRTPEAKTPSEVIRIQETFKKNLKKFITLFLSENIPDNKIYEIALSIIALHYLFFYDFISKTIFMTTPQKKGGKIIDSDFEDSNVVLNYIMHRNGCSEDEINKVLNQNINPDELIINKTKLPVTIPTMNSDEIDIFINKLLNLYNFPPLENVSLNEIKDNWESYITRHINSGKFRITNVILNGNESKRDPALLPNYIKYRINIKLLGLIESIKKTRFSNKIPIIFKNDNLMKLCRSLKNQDVPFDKEPILKSACKEIKLSYTTVYMGLDDKLKYHPSYEDIMKAIEPKGEKIHYRKLAQILIISSEEDLKNWKQNVEKLVN